MSEPPRNDTAGDRLARLSPERRALLEKRLLSRAAPPASSLAVLKRPTDRPPRLSVVQELLWLVDQLGTDSSVYNSSGVVRLQGELDADALARALAHIVERHEALRTSFDVVDATPVQVVHDLPLHLSVESLESLPPSERAAALDRLVWRETRWRFDLSKPLLFRATLARLTPQDHVLITVAHHIVWDGWSKGVFYRELAAAYTAYREGADPQLPSLPFQYADYAEWQRHWLDQGERARQLAYWRKQLDGAPAVLELSTDRRRPAVQSHRGARESHWFTADLTARLKEFSRQNQVTLFMTLMAGFHVLLHRWSRQADILVGTPIAARNRTELEGLIGYFTNTVVIRTDCGKDPTFAELLRDVQQACLDAYAHQDVSFNEVVQEVAPARDLSHSPLFQVLFVLQNATTSRMSLPGVSVERVEHQPATAKFDLSLGMGEHDGRLHASLEYATDLFDAPTIVRMHQHFEQLLTAAVMDPDRPVSTLPMVPDHERRLVIEEWNATDRDLGTRPVTEAIERLAVEEPDSSAVVAADARLTRGELRGWSLGVATALRERGVGRGDVVAVCAPRSAAFVAAVLGVLRSGAAYVPLDPDYPHERVEFMLRDCGAAAVLVTSDTVLPADTAVPQVDVHACRSQTDGSDLSSPRSDDLAYVMYTSGTTGRPKGVMVTHACLANHVGGAVQTYGLSSTDRVMQFSSTSFDISVEEIFGALVAGATLVVRPHTLPLAGAEWLEFIKGQAISVLDVPTSFWHEWVFDLDLRGMTPPDSLRLVIVGGSEANPATYTTWQRITGGRVDWVNTYGPTETTVVATSYRPTPDRDLDDPAVLPIGKPWPNVRTYVLDDHLQPVPVGVVGELFIGGAGVARGYLGDAELTEQRFLSSPFAPGERLYRSGDLVRWLSDGNLEFVGRRDQQVKVRGYRVEPSEVERVLLEHGQVGEAVVVPRREGSLAAYVVAHEESVSRDELRAFLRDRLPAYMVPATVTVLAALPLTPNGKVDTDALPVELATPTPRCESPRTETERVLHDIWSEALGAPVASIHDNFFDVGGHSLLALRVFALVEARMGKRLPLSTLVAAPTIATLAEVIDRPPSIGESVSLVSLQPHGTRPPLFIVHEIDGDVIGYRHLVRALGDDQPVFGLQAVGLHRDAAVIVDISEMARRYAEEIRQFRPHGPYRLVGSCFGGVVAYELARTLRAAGEQVELVVMIDAVPFGYPGAVRPPRAKRLRDRIRSYVDLRASSPGRRRYVRLLWWRRARRYLQQGAVLPEKLHNMVLVHHHAASQFVTRPYDGDVVHIVRDGAELQEPWDPRLRWHDLARSVRTVRAASATQNHREMLLPGLVEQCAAAIQDNVERLVLR